MEDKIPMQDEIQEEIQTEQAVVQEPAPADTEKPAENNTEEIVLSDYVPKKRKGFFYGCYLVIKRVFDFLSSFVVSLLLLLPVLIVALIVICKDFGNPFYKQKRVGKKGKKLKIWKFRSMKKGADNLEKMLTPEQLEEYKKEYKLDDDPRLIGYKKAGDGANGKCFGAKIRKTSIDELPQIIFNICILGNMSVVGPRPMLNEELDKYYTPEQKALLLTAKPGLTGYWQAYARNNATYKSGERQKMELYYIEHRSVWLDIKIIFKTFIGVLKKDGAK
ncbi:MAG: sugar transferase [Clostridia bacterium]|nr:sugar transferase [Clostridia bacterium]